MENIKINRIQKIAMALFAGSVLQGCVQYSDTLNRPQPMVFAPADGGNPVLFDQNQTMPAVDVPQVVATKTASATRQSTGLHPNIEYYFDWLCEQQRDGIPDDSCDFSINVPYQDEDVALVTGEETGFHGSGGYAFYLLDLKGKPGDVLFRGHAMTVSVKRQGSNIIIYSGYDKGGIKENNKNTINLKKKPPVTHGF